MAANPFGKLRRRQILAILLSVDGAGKNMPGEHEGLEPGLLQTLGSLIEMQKQLLAGLARATGKYDLIEDELVKLNRHGHRLEEKMAENTARLDANSARLDTHSVRLDAIVRRLDDIDQAVAQNTAEMRSTQIEIIGMRNEILNGMQSGLFGQAEIRELRERVEALERRIGQ